MDTEFINSKIRAGESFLLANDGQYLGRLTLNQYAADSIFNQYGSYGSQYSATSIFNKYGNYGSPYSSLSPYNAYSNTPPVMYLFGRINSYLTKNLYLSHTIVDPDNLVPWLRKHNLLF